MGVGNSHIPPGATGGSVLKWVPRALPVRVGSGLSIGVLALPEMMAVETLVEAISGGTSWRDQLPSVEKPDRQECAEYVCDAPCASPVEAIMPINEHDRQASRATQFLPGGR